MGWFASLFLAACLAACTGLRAFLPVLEVALASRFGLVGSYRVPTDLRWMESDPFLVAVGLLALLEIVSDKIPWVARVFELPLLILRPMAGVLACFAVLQMPTVAWNFTAALAVGLLFSQPILRLKTGFRMIRWQWNRAWVNPGLSLAEDLLAGGAAMLAFFHPVPVLLALLGLAFWLLTRVRLDLYRRSMEPEALPAQPTGPLIGYGPRPQELDARSLR